MHAVNKEIIIIPFRIENVLPEKAMELFISANHWLDAITPPVEVHINYLVQNVQKVLSGNLDMKFRHNPIREIELIAARWVEDGHPYEMLEDFNRKLQLFIREPPEDLVFKDENTLLMLMMAALHFGSNWGFWVEQNQDNSGAVRQLLIHLDHHYFRPRLRALYALQHFPETVVKAELAKLGASVAAGNRTLIDNYVYSKTVLEYLDKLQGALELDMGVKVAAVKREIEKFRGSPPSDEGGSSLPIL